MYKKLIENSLDILFDRLDQCRDKRVVTSVSNYLMLAVYRMFRRLYQAAPGNVASMFRVRPPAGSVTPTPPCSCRKVSFRPPWQGRTAHAPTPLPLR